MDWQFLQFVPIDKLTRASVCCGIEAVLSYLGTNIVKFVELECATKTHLNEL